MFLPGSIFGGITQLYLLSNSLEWKNTYVAIAATEHMYFKPLNIDWASTMCQILVLMLDVWQISKGDSAEVLYDGSSIA